MPGPSRASSKAELVRLAIAGIDAEIERLMAQRIDIAKMAPGQVSVPPQTRGPGRPKKSNLLISDVAPPVKKTRKQRIVSAETKKKLSLAAQARWARVKGE